jgi:drug/metabolite transporter (DMT)-like permease
VPTVVSALAAAVLLGTGFVLQQHRAALEPSDRALTVWLLLDLVRSPSWLAGIGVMAAGQLLGAAALARGGLGMTEPLLSTNLLFALVIAGFWYQLRPCWRDWLGVLVLSGGLGGFLVVATPGIGDTSGIPDVAWVLAGGSVAAVAAVLTVAGRRNRGRVRGALLAGGAGVLFGLQDALTQRSLAIAGHRGVLQLLLSWTPYTLVAVAVVGILLAQSAFQAAPLSASLPPVTAGEPITGIALGAGLFGGSLQHGSVALLLEVVCLLAMIAGIWLVASSPMVTSARRTAEAGRGAPSPVGGAGEH